VISSANKAIAVLPAAIPAGFACERESFRISDIVLRPFHNCHAENSAQSMAAQAVKHPIQFTTHFNDNQEKRQGC
jgi:hypothetical protein